MKLHTASRLAILALVELAANPDRTITVSAIGRKYGASAHHLAKVMQVLGRAGLVRSIRGSGGGYAFTGNARRVTLLDLVEMFEPSYRDDGVEESKSGMSAECALDQVMREITEITMATLGSITLATMIKLVQRCERAAPAEDEGA